MQTTPLKLLDVVALLEDRPSDNLVAGQVGSIVEVLAPDAFEVEFVDLQGRTIGLIEADRNSLLALKRERASAG